MTPQPADFGLVATYGNWHDRLAGWAIRWGTDSPVNHAFVYVGGGRIVEAAPGGARNVLLDYNDVTWSTGHISLTAVQRRQIVTKASSFARRRVGYGWLDLIAIGLAQRRTFGLVHAAYPLADQPWWVRRIESMDTLICSQLVDLAYQAAGVHLFGDGRIPGLVSPGDLYQLLSRDPAEVTR